MKKQDYEPDGLVPSDLRLLIKEAYELNDMNVILNLKNQYEKLNREHCDNVSSAILKCINFYLDKKRQDGNCQK